MTLWEILKANKTGIAPDMFTMLAASKMNGGRDRLHELSGIPPLSFTAKGKPLSAWSITGNTVQNGTPTPENPVDVQSVGDYDSETGMYKIPVVTRGKNLISKIIKKSNLNSDGLIFEAEKYNLGVAKVEPNKTYCFYVDDEEVSVYGFFANEPEINSITIDGNRYIAPMNTKISVTVPSNANFIVIRRIGNFDSFQLEEGSVATPYEPYHEPITTPIYLPTPLYSGEVMRSDGTITRSDGTTETFTAPQIPTLNGTTVIDVDTAVKPESMTIKYRR